MNIIARLYCFIFGHDIPCGTCGLCQRCYNTVFGNWDEETSQFRFNPTAISIRDIYDRFYLKAKYG